jgi:acyl carrier protein
VTANAPIAADQISVPSALTERTVAALWTEVLQTSALPDSTANFFELGGDSIAMVMLEFRIKEELSVELPAGTVLGAPTLRELSAVIDAARDGSPSAHDNQLADELQELTRIPGSS